MSVEILYNRFLHLMKPLRGIQEVTDTLFNQKIITDTERINVLSYTDLNQAKRALSQVLCERKAGDYVRIASVFTNEQKRQYLEAVPSSEGDDNSTTATTTVTASSTTTASSTEESSTTTSEGSEGAGDNESDSEGTEAGGNFGGEFSTAGCSTPTRQGKYEGSEGAFLKSNKEVADEFVLRSRQQASYTYTQPGGGSSNTKHLTTDVPDPPTEVVRPSKTQSSNSIQLSPKMEDAFIILLFTFFTQQLQLLWGRRPQDLKNSLPPQRAQSHPQHKEKDSGTSIPQWPGPGMFPWLEVDVQAEECRDYFPSDKVKSVQPNPNNPTPLKLSVILEAFQQFLRGFEALKNENQSLQRKGRMYDELFKKYRILEEKLNQTRSEPYQQGRNGISHSQHPANLEKMAHLEEKIVRLEAMIADQEEQLRQVNPLQRAYTRSEERCKQLVEVTQQWSIECEEKLKVIKMLEKEAEQLKAQIQQLDGRVNKYKKYWMDTKDMQVGRVSDVQFEELRSELASRRQLYDQVLAQRDETTKKLKLLELENESLKDHNVQLMDRADNFKVQAQAKEPSVREMSNLLQQNRKLETELEASRKENAELSDKAVGLEILVQDMTAKLDHSQGFHRPTTKRSQAMVIGYGAPIRGQSTSHPSQLLVAPTNPPIGQHHRSESAYSRDDEDRLSLTSSEASESGKFSSFGSTSEKQSSRIRGGSSRPPSNHSSFGSHDLPLKSRDPLLNEAAPPGEPAGTPQEGEDYTHRIRYPNNSRILVSPLLDEEISLRGGSGGSTASGTKPEAPKFRDQGVAGGVGGLLKSRDPPDEIQPRSKSPNDAFFCDRSHFDHQVPHYPNQLSNEVDVAPPPNQPTAFLPPNSAFLKPPSVEKKCPVCHHTFLTLSEREFQSHVSTCNR